MTDTKRPGAASAARMPTYAWWLVLALVGLDYFSTLGYLPSIAIWASPENALLATAAVVALTLFAALPVYLYVVGRSPHGYGGTGLLEKLVHGWSGKFFLLILLGFIGTDFVVTRTLSVADAAHHLVHNNYWQQHAQWFTEHRETVRSWFPAMFQGRFFDFWNEQIIVTIVLSVLAFGVYFFIVRGFNRPFMVVAALVVLLYLVLTGIIITNGVIYIAHHPERLQNWFHRISGHASGRGLLEVLPGLALIALLSAPELALGLSGFELSMTSAPLVRGRDDDDPERPRGRIRRTRMLLVAAVLIMGVFMLGSVLTVSQLVPQKALQGDAALHEDWTGDAMHRALAYLAHGEKLTADQIARLPDAEKAIAQVRSEDVSPLFGPAFGTLYDISTILILCLAGASVAISLKQLVPQYLAKFGMQLQWAEKVGAILHLFNITILLVTIVFQASVAAQQWAYAASVLVLLMSASLAAFLEVRRRWRGSSWRLVVGAPFFLILTLFLVLVGVTFTKDRTGLYIPMLFVGVLIVTGFLSRLLRSTELRCRGFELADEHSRRRWEVITQYEFQVLVPHRPHGLTLAEKEKRIRHVHRLGPDVPIIFIEATLEDPSEFQMTPLLKIEHREGQEIIVVDRCASIAHVIAAVALEFRKVGKPPEVHFAWSEESPITANLGFLLFGEGNIPWMVHALLRKAEPDPLRQPRVIVG
jgi:hypothetical protein